MVKLNKQVTDLKDKPQKKKNVSKVETVKKDGRRRIRSEGKKLFELEKKYGRFEGESFGWNDD